MHIELSVLLVPSGEDVNKLSERSEQWRWGLEGVRELTRSW